MVVVMAKPLGRPENVLPMVLNESWHAPVQSAALAFAGTQWERVNGAMIYNDKAVHRGQCSRILQLKSNMGVTPARG